MSRPVAALVAVLLLAAGAAGWIVARDGGASPYLVRAVFDNASFVIPGEDVKVAGVEVGRIDSLDLTADHKAVVVLRIDDPAFRPFRRDAACRIGLMSLIGEQFVECEPTQPRADGEPLPPELARIPDGRPGAGQHLLGVDHTVTPVGLDLINNVMRLPERERLRLVVNELGAGLAGNGEALAAALRRADPALREADRLVATLARQDEVLGRLVDESDAVLAPLAGKRRALSGFIRGAGATAAAAAARGDALEASLRRLPGFLQELRPAADRLGGLAGAVEPAVGALAAQAPAIAETVARLRPFSEAAAPALTSLGDVAERGRRTFPRIRPLADRLAALGRPLAPLAAELAALGASFDRAGGIEELMRTLYFYTGAINGEDAVGHYVRAGLGVNGTCIERAYEPAPGCAATFDSSGEAARTSADPATTAVLDYLLGPEDATR